MESDEEHDPVPDQVENPRVKKRKKRKRAGRKKRIATGFEEYFADAPTTSAEALKEQEELYSPTVPFPQRIQTCIYRYRTRRRFDPEHSLYFNEYAFLGGIDTSHASFNEADVQETSLLPQLYSSPSSSDAAASSRFYDGNARNWTVDFTAVVSGFLSVTLPPLTGLEEEPMEKAIGVVENFLRYVLQHDVCPEYDEDIRRAMGVCAGAREEWPRLGRLKSILPGRFQLAAAQTFGVHGEADWSLQRCKPSERLSPELVFYASLVAVGESVPKTADRKSDLRITRKFKCDLELQRVELPGDDIANYFRRLALGSQALDLQPLGRAIFRSTTIEDGWAHQVDPENPPPEEDVVFYYEQEILAEMTPGMKAKAEVCELSTGFRFVKAFEEVLPSFHRFLPQHLMKHFVPPRANDRPPRSIHDKPGGDVEAEPEEDKSEDKNSEGEQGG